MMNKDFNTVASEPSPPPYAELKTALERARLNLSMLDAAQKGDWNAMRDAIDAGADPAFKGNKAIGLLTQSLTPEAVSLMQRLDNPAYPRLRLFPLVLAAMHGDVRLADDMLKKNPPQGVLCNAAYCALRNGHNAFADKILPHIDTEQYSDGLMTALLLHRPAAFDAAIGPDAYPDDLMFYLTGAAVAKDEAAMNHVLDLLIEKKDKMLNLVRIDMRDGSMISHEENLSVLFTSGHIGVIERYLDNFSELLPSASTLLHIADHVSDAGGVLYTRLLEKFPLREEDAQHCIQIAAKNGRRAHVLALEKTYQQAAKKNAAAMILSAIYTGDERIVFDTLAAGYALPKLSAQQFNLLNAALAKGMETVCEHIIDATEDKSALAALLRTGGHLAQLKTAAAIDGNIRFEKDHLFWLAAKMGDKNTLALFDGLTDIKPAYPVIVAQAVGAVAKRGDIKLLEHMVQHCDWERDAPLKGLCATHLAHRACMDNPQALMAAAPLAEPRPLEKDDFCAIAPERFTAVLNVLTAQGFTIDKTAMGGAMSAALQDETANMMGGMLSHGADLNARQSSLAAGLDSFASPAMVDVLSKWVARADMLPSENIKILINAAPDEAALFTGTDSLAVQAAYANDFPHILEKAGNAFNVQKLVETKDAQGNNLLDILGAHGRLNDVLVPALWKKQDAKVFLLAHTAPCYLPQCDFAALAASLHQLKLKESHHKRFTLKGRGQA